MDNRDYRHVDTHCLECGMLRAKHDNTDCSRQFHPGCGGELYLATSEQHGDYAACERCRELDYPAMAWEEYKRQNLTPPVYIRPTGKQDEQS